MGWIRASKLKLNLNYTKILIEKFLSNGEAFLKKNGPYVKDLSIRLELLLGLMFR